MKTLLLLINLLILPFPVLGADLLLKNATLIDGTGTSAKSIENLLIRDGRIVGVDVKEPGQDIEIIDLKDAWIIPGLIDAHVHLSGFEGDRREMPGKLERALRGGITGLRDMAGDTRVLKDTVSDLHLGLYPGPTLTYAGLMGGPTMFDDPRVLEASIGYAPGEAPGLRAIDQETDAGKAMADLKTTGASAAKLYGNLDRDTVLRLGKAAHKAGVRIWAHPATFPARPMDLIEAGADVLSHSAYFIWQAVPDMPTDYNARRHGPYGDYSPDDNRYQQVIERMAAGNVLLDATLTIHYDHAVEANEPLEGVTDNAFTWATAFTRRAHKAGVKIVAGTDALFPSEKQDPEGDDLPNLHRELEILVNYAGLTPMEALVAGTRNSAEAAGLLQDHGTIEPGKVADLVVLNTDPVRDITATRDIRMVIRAGKIIPQK
ncbi:amidohydrolase family protein [Emcibacter sp.]|uniref:amidohydrolase family protein n=1 Tax=Emcibacter sp. TaxID=1979954 RepID=UPI003A8D9AB5